MSRSGAVSAVWAGRHCTFRLGIAELDELDELCKIGPGHLLALVSAGVSGPWKARQLREVLRLGLIGGGEAPNKALALVERYFDTDRNPLNDSLLTVQMILMACVVGSEADADAGERQGETAPTASPSVASTSAKSTRSRAIGLADVGRLSLWQFNRLFAGWRRANEADETRKGALSDKERGQLEAMLAAAEMEQTHG